MAERPAASTVDPKDWESVDDWQNVPSPNKGAGDAYAPQAPQTFGHAVGSAVDAVNPFPAIGSAMTHNPIKPGGILHGLYQGSADQASKAKDSFQKGDYSEAIGHGLGTIPLIGPAAAAVGEKMGGHAPTFDKYGKVIEQGELPDLAGGAGGTAGLIGATYAPRLAAKGIRALPSATRAGAHLGEVEAAAGHVPINLVEPTSAAMEMQDWANAGSQMPQVGSKFLGRMSDPAAGPMPFSEGRKFYSNASKLSANERSGLTAPMQRLVGSQFAPSLNKGLTEAAETVGQGDKYTQAMREYRNAMRIRGAVSKAGDIAKKAAIPALIGGGAAGYIARRTLGP